MSTGLRRRGRRDTRSIYRGAMVYFADGYEQPDYPRLPERIKSSHTAVRLVYPVGAPLSAALAAAPGGLA